MGFSDSAPTMSIYSTNRMHTRVHYLGSREQEAQDTQSLILMENDFILD